MPDPPTRDQLAWIMCRLANGHGSPRDCVHWLIAFPTTLVRDAEGDPWRWGPSGGVEVGTLVGPGGRRSWNPASPQPETGPYRIDRDTILATLRLLFLSTQAVQLRVGSE